MTKTMQIELTPKGGATWTGVQLAAVRQVLKRCLRDVGVRCTYARYIFDVEPMDYDF